MTVEKRRELRRFEGSSVNLALADGSRLDDVSLVSARAQKFRRLTAICLASS